MKPDRFTEAAAVILALLGVSILVSGLMPFINPGFVDANNNGDYSPRMQFLVPTLVSLPILGLAWHLNQKARAARWELGLPAVPSETSLEKKLKWVVFGILVVLILVGFLF